MSAPPVDPTSLENLYDIAMPPPIPWWPLAPGWYVVGGVLVQTADGVWSLGTLASTAPGERSGLFFPVAKGLSRQRYRSGLQCAAALAGLPPPGPGSATLMDDLLGDHANADLRRNVEALQEAVLRRAATWDGTGLAAALHRRRRERQRHETAAAEGRLPALNPRPHIN